MRVVVIGAGVIGAAVAARLGGEAQVSLVDAAHPGSGTTAHSMAWVNAHAKTPRHYHELAVAGMRAHAELAERTGAGCGWYRRPGTLRWASAGPGLEQLEQTVTRLRDWGYRARWITVAQARELEPAVRIDGRAQVAYFADEALVEPQQLVDHLMGVARDGGVAVRTGAAARVVGISTAGGRVRGVRLAGGERLAADVVVCCAGWRTPAVAALAGARVPLVPGDAPASSAPTLLAHLEPADAETVTHMLLSTGLHARPLAGGRIYLEALDLNEEVDQHTSAARIAQLARELLARARSVMPAVVRRARLAGGRVCTRPMPPDDNPIVGWNAEAPGLYTVVTHSGITLSLHLAELVAREVLTGREVADLAPYRPGRFT